MILELFLVLLIVAVVALSLGYFTGDPHYAYIGLFFIFILGVILFTGNVEYETGLNITTVGGVTYVNYMYDDFTGDYARWFGVFLAVSAGAGMALLMLNFKRSKE